MASEDCAFGPIGFERVRDVQASQAGLGPPPLRLPAGRRCCRCCVGAPAAAAAACGAAAWPAAAAASALLEPVCKPGPSPPRLHCSCPPCLHCF